ncbi:MAG: DUF2510 domain-containing protein [Arachnia sp.]
MSAPGWYPDPSGDKGALRYFDGATWTQHSRSATTTGPVAPGRPWGWFILAMVVIAGLVAVFVLRPVSLNIGAGDTNSARPTGSQWNELPTSETPTQPENPGKGSVIDCPQNSFDARSETSSDGRMHGGGLSFVPPEGSSWQPDPVFMPWLYDHNSTTRSIVWGWQSNVSVGQVQRSEGFSDPRNTAAQLMGCLASSGLYLGFTGREDLLDESFILDGDGGWRMTANVFVDSQGDIRGDVVDVIVLDLGDPDTLAVYISCATIDDETNLEEVAAVAESLRVE